VLRRAFNIMSNEVDEVISAICRSYYPKLGFQGNSLIPVTTLSLGHVDILASRDLLNLQHLGIYFQSRTINDSATHH
jgi:hypothetical protein